MTLPDAHADRLLAEYRQPDYPYWCPGCARVTARPSDPCDCPVPEITPDDWAAYRADMAAQDTPELTEGEMEAMAAYFAEEAKLRG